jgi:hypothetical protein
MARTCSDNGEQQVPQKIVNGTPEGKRSSGRSRLRWLDNVLNDLRIMGVRQCRKKAEGR